MRNMNERIKELIRESHLDVYGLGKDRANWEATVLESTQMIVKECIKINRQELSFVAFNVLHDRYEEHFGTKPDWKPYEFQEL